MKRSHSTLLVHALAAALPAGGCRQSTVAPAPDGTTAPPTAAAPDASATTAPDAPATAAVGHGSEVDPAAGAAGLRFRPPDSWTTVTPSNSMRVAQYTLAGPAGDAELVVYHFGGGGAGSVDANLDRWLGQFEQPDGGSSREAAEISRREIGGMAVHEVDLSGTFVAETAPGSGERVNRPDYRMLAAIVLADAGPYYFKLVGPAATVAVQADAWRELLATVRQ